MVTAKYRKLIAVGCGLTTVSIIGKMRVIPYAEGLVHTGNMRMCKLFSMNCKYHLFISLFRRPWALRTVDQFRPPPPPSTDLNSEQFRQELEEIVALGGKNSSQRTAEQEEIALFWADGFGSVSTSGTMIRIGKFSFMPFTI